MMTFKQIVHDVSLSGTGSIDDPASLFAHLHDVVEIDGERYTCARFGFRPVRA